MLALHLPPEKLCPLVVSVTLPLLLSLGVCDGTLVILPGFWNMPCTL